MPGILRQIFWKIFFGYFWPKSGQKSTWLAKILAENSEIQNLPLIPLPIYKPIFFAGRFEPILLNKVEIQPGRVVLQLPLRGLITQIPFNPGGLLRCRSDSRSRIFKVSSRSCPFGYGQFLAKFGIFGQIGIWHFKSTLKSLQIITMSFKNKFSAIQSSVHFPNKQLLMRNK